MVDASACLAAGECTVISKTAEYVIYGLFAGFGVLAVIVIITFFLTPAWTFLMAKIHRKPVIYVVIRAQRGKFISGTSSHEGLV